MPPGRGASTTRATIDLTTLPTGKTYLTKPDTKLISSILDSKGIVTKTGDDILLYSIDGVEFDAIKYSDEALEDLVKGNQDLSILRVKRVGHAGENYKFLNAVGEYQPQIAKAEGKNFAAVAGKEGVGGEIVANKALDSIVIQNDDIIEQAKAFQRNAGYNIDQYSLSRLRKGTVICGLSPGQSHWYTDIASIEKCGYSYKKMYEGLQIAPHSVHGYRTKITFYEVIDDVDVAAGLAQANKTINTQRGLIHLGEGGLTQYVVFDYEKFLKPIKTIVLHD